ncbi:MAG: hypothetical protein HUJ98_12215 [Bacteroidaceae bacterium]|nr:hypothetical protein [Bacteroidaceae bacterium]MCF0187238.1 hypothetical protein [Bacteroidaceae bacterium]
MHSPFAYNFIRTVINEKSKYYAYDDLKPMRKKMKGLASHRVDKLLFRLANYFQPAVAIQIGAAGSLSLRYIQAGCKQANCQVFTDVQRALHFLELTGEQSLGMLYISETDQYKEIFEALLPWTHAHTVIVIDTPYSDEEKRQWWHSLEDDMRVKLTFDLYEAGIILFNYAYKKHHYKVNFM